MLGASPVRLQRLILSVALLVQGKMGTTVEGNAYACHRYDRLGHLLGGTETWAQKCLPREGFLEGGTLVFPLTPRVSSYT
jgi:hypothetical protein